MNLALGLPADSPPREIVKALADARAPLAPRVVPSAPCKENVSVGDAVDLLKLPTPLIHGHDGGRYLQTYGLTIVSQTDTAMEGPMDEYPGYVGDRGSPKPVLHVTAITHRNQPILPFSTAGAPVDENHTGWGLPHSAEILHLLRSHGEPVDRARHRRDQCRRGRVGVR